MKSIFLPLFLIIPAFVSGQIKFYGKDGTVVNAIGERTTLTFSKNESLPVPQWEPAEEGFTVTTIAALLPSVIDLGFKITSNVMEKRLKEYVNEFSARNTYTDNNSYISGFKIERTLVRETANNSGDAAFSLSLIPLPVDTNTFVFAVDGISVNYSGARTKKGYNLNDYLIEIKVSYYDGSEKKEQASNPITLQMVGFGAIDYALSGPDGTRLYITDKFPLNPDLTISEVSVKVVETNTAKAKVEKIKAISDKYKEDAKEGTKNIINLFIEQQESTDEDESE
ncbi:hypothetical protein [Parapedobacter indicus]|uniref:Uncharacterized protein n=1 Tax=Parapedobacter indicus TaxID=1477437 RepID=A0A1I3CKI3_9SPHI|nr:hypothetical protein [Parapedobacter indicus]PPL04280.1 hypothetical protein CLV26_10181 [Parapedobacter indicus]SFH74813.1 hypothetical protein SAMN05444682_10168 [Parapedobacter indicus]